jgi:hypothetical protein
MEWNGVNSKSATLHNATREKEWNPSSLSFKNSLIMHWISAPDPEFNVRGQRLSILVLSTFEGDEEDRFGREFLWHSFAENKSLPQISTD